jgi:predicted acylesterase/phospholipase RssA
MKNLERYMREAVLEDNHFQSLGVRLNVVATQLNHSRKVIFGHFPQEEKNATRMLANFATVSEAVAASASLPPIFSPYPIRKDAETTMHFFDGEIRDTLSTDVAIDQGCDLILASYSTMPYHFNSQMGSLHEYGMPMIFNQALYQVIEQKIHKHREHVEKTKSLIHAVVGYMRELGRPDQEIDKMTEILCSKTGYKPDVTSVYIHPQPQDHEMFFYDHFSLNPRILARIAKTGFRSAVATLRKYNIY